MGSFTHAAEALFLTQPTIFMQIKMLTETLVMPLFGQLGRTLRATDAGYELSQSCRKGLEIMANQEMKISDIQGVRRGRLRLAVISTVN